jgi:CheY-like chemotaxis protein
MPNSLKILLIEDDRDDVELFSQALEDNGISHSVHLLRDGLAIIKYTEALKGELPDLIVMDFNLPLMHGRDVLLHIKQSQLKKVPLVVLTTSSAEADKKYVYTNGGDKFITKPSSMEEIKKMVSEIAGLMV